MGRTKSLFGIKSERRWGNKVSAIREPLNIESFERCLKRIKEIKGSSELIGVVSHDMYKDDELMYQLGFRSKPSKESDENS